MPSSAFRSLLVLISIVFCATILRAQGNQEAETRAMYFRITKIEKLGKDSIVAVIKGGSKYGLKKGLTGPVNGYYKKGNDRSSLEVGFASVLTLDDDNTWVLIRPSEKTDEQYQVKIDDYVKLNITVPKLAYRSIFFELALQDIVFKDNNGKPLYNFELLRNNDSKTLEDSILLRSAKDIIETYEAVKNDTAWKHLYIPMTEGRFAGKSVFDLMKDCKPKDMHIFLNYAGFYAKYYMGTSWTITQVYYTWITNKPSYNKKEIYDSIVAYKNKPTLLKEFLQKNISYISGESFVTKWIGEAGELASDGKIAAAMEMFDVAKITLPYLKNDCLTAYYFYCYTNIHDYKKEYLKNVQLYDSSYHYFKKCDNPFYEIQSLMNKALSYYSAEKYDESLKVLEQMLVEAEKPRPSVTPTEKASFIAQYHHVAGFIYQAKDDPKKAAEAYENAIRYYQQLGTYDYVQKIIKIQEKVAGIYKKQGELVKALAIYNEQYSNYAKLNDRKNMAHTLDDIALIEFQLSNYRKAIANFSAAKETFLFFNMMSNAGYSQSNIGQAYWNLGKYDSAIAAHQTAIGYRRMANNFDGLAYSWKKIGDLYKKTGEKDKAFFAYDSSSHYYSLAKDSTSLKDLLADVGDIYYNDKQYQKAFDYYLQRHKLNMAGTDKIATASSGYQLAEAATYFDLPMAKKYALSTLEISQKAGDKNNEYAAATLLGFIGYRNYDYDEGNSYFNKALNIAIEQKNKSAEVTCYQYMSRAYSSKLDFDKAEFYVQKAIKIADSLGDKSKLPDLYRTLGGIIQQKGDFYGARKEYQKSIDIAYSINSRADVGYGYSIITFLYVIQGELAKAEQSTDSLYSIFSQLNNSWQMAEAYANKGMVYEAKADGINAMKYYLLADSIYKKEKDIYSQAVCQTQLGCVYYYQADFDNALKYFYECDRMISTINATTELHILSPINIGEALYYKKDYAKAEPFLLKGYKMANEKKAGRMQTIGASFLGTLYYDLKKYELAEKYLLEGFSLAEKSNETDLYINSGMYLGKLYVTLNQPAKAEKYYRKTVDFLKTIDHSKYTWMALYEYGLNFYNNKNYDSAIVYFKQAVEIVENRSQNLFGGAEAKKIYNADERKVDLYNKLVASLAKINKPDDALYYADKGNTHAVKQQMEGAGLVTNDKEKSDAIKKGGELLQKKNAVEQAIVKEKAKPEKEQNKQLIASLESVKNVAEADYTSYIEYLQKKYEDLQSYFSNTNPKDFKNYIEDIPDSTIVVLYVINKSKENNQLLIFTVTNKETAIKVVDLKQDIDKQASRFLSILRNPNNATGTGAVTLRSTLKPVDDVRGDFKTESGDLYNLLITPIAEQLKDKKKVCFIPNGKLSSIPFQCLGYMDENKKFHFIVEDMAIFYTSKIDIFRKQFKKRSIENSMVAFGNPDKSLPGATREVNEIGKIIKGTTVFVEEQATETKAKEGLAKYTFIHYATHGVLDYEKFENSFLLFAADGSNDGKLTIGEINGTSKPSSSLVFLSACETAVNKEEAKGYYSSPANAFLTNRVDAVVGSLWKVPDEATDLLVTEFYKNLKNGGMGNADALRHAQATVSQNPKYTHPFFWSAFVLYGEWR
jgi:CHAT domain-containing protein